MRIPSKNPKKLSGNQKFPSEETNLGKKATFGSALVDEGQTDCDVPVSFVAHHNRIISFLAFFTIRDGTSVRTSLSDLSAVSIRFARTQRNRK